MHACVFIDQIRHLFDKSFADCTMCFPDIDALSSSPFITPTLTHVENWHGNLYSFELTVWQVMNFLAQYCTTEFYASSRDIEKGIQWTYLFRIRKSKKKWFFFSSESLCIGCFQSNLKCLSNEMILFIATKRNIKMNSVQLLSAFHCNWSMFLWRIHYNRHWVHNKWTAININDA